MKTPLNEVANSIAWADSYLLGWVASPSEVRLFLHVRVLEGHPCFREFDRRREAGDFHLAVLSGPGLRDSGLLLHASLPTWDAALMEFRDVAEIEEVDVNPDRVRIVAGQLELAFAGGPLLEVLDDEGPDALASFLDISA